MQTRIEKIDKNPICFKCGKEAVYIIFRRGFFYRYEMDCCKSCLLKHISKLNIFFNKDRLIEEKQQ